MKKLIKEALFLALIGIVIVGCEKEEASSINPNATVSNSNKNKSLSQKSQSYFTVDDSAYSILSEITEQMGYESITTSDDEYNIFYGASNYGSAKIPLDDYVPTLAGPKIKITIKLAIYSRKKGCIHGIGLRCKLNNGINQNPDETPIRMFEAELEVNESENTLDIQFTEPVDWELLND
mgnify:CR=1 FL=1